MTFLCRVLLLVLACCSCAYAVVPEPNEVSGMEAGSFKAWTSIETQYSILSNSLSAGDLKSAEQNADAILRGVESLKHGGEDEALSAEAAQVTADLERAAIDVKSAAAGGNLDSARLAFDQMKVAIPALKTALTKEQ